MSKREKLSGNAKSIPKSTITSRLKSFSNDQSGATAIEYGLIAGGIVLMIIPIVFQLGETTMVTFYQELVNQIN